ncbi:MAG: hypothetical protein HY903_02130 [Deltaproteobacteria bacterium]|nr:hypothetical protein [Deltaproteobacteria bacterium]
MPSRSALLSFACVSLMVATALAKPAAGGKPKTANGPLTADNALALAKQVLPSDDGAKEVKLVGSSEGKFVGLASNKVVIVGPALALLVNVEEKAADIGTIRVAPHLFVVKTQGDQIELVSHLEPADLTYEIDPKTDKGTKIALSTLPVAKDGVGIVATLRKAEGSSSGASASVEETMILYVVQGDTLTIAFSVKVETSATERVSGVVEGTKETNKVELGKKGGRLVDLVVTTRKFETKGDNTDEYRPTTERWCWSDKATTYLPECK